MYLHSKNTIVRLEYGSLLLGPLFSVLSVPTFQENIRMVRVPAFYLFQRPPGSGPGSAHFKSPGVEVLGDSKKIKTLVSLIPNWIRFYLPMHIPERESLRENL
jgi:hypothetical protein